MSEEFKPVRSYLLSSNSESKIFTKSLLITDCLEMLDSVTGLLWSLALIPCPMVILLIDWKTLL